MPREAVSHEQEEHSPGQFECFLKWIMVVEGQKRTPGSRQEKELGGQWERHEN